MTKTRAPKRGARDGRTSASEKRRRDILLAGKKIFFECGYQVALASRELIDALPPSDAVPKEPWEGLRTFVARVRKVASRPETVRLYRLVIAEAERRPELGRGLYETAFRGPERILAAYLGSCIAQSRLKSHGAAVSARIIPRCRDQQLCIRGLTGFADAGENRLGQRASDHVVDMLEAALRLQKTFGGA